MFKNLKLSKKFNLLLLLVFVVVILATGSCFAALLNHNAQNQITAKAVLMMATMNSVRTYTNEQVNPLLKDELYTVDEFIPQTVPGYSAREVFEYLRQSEEFKEFFYKEATLNPTNLRDKADAFETDIVEKFRRDPKLPELRGLRPSPIGDNLYYIARPIQITKESCLVCHSTPDAAPKSQIATYGDRDGFGWQLNEIVGAQIVSVPAGSVFQSAARSFMVLMTISIVIFALAIVLINVLLSRAVIRPLDRMAAIADQVSTGQLDTEFDESSQDEIGHLAASFNRMKYSLSMAMKMLNRTNSTFGNPSTPPSS
jgi:HAMP domain-containing protein